MTIIAIIGFLLFITVICVIVYKFVSPLFSDLPKTMEKSDADLQDTLTRLGIQITQDFGEIEDLRLGKVVIKVSAALGIKDSRDCLTITTVRGKKQNLKTTVCFFLNDPDNAEALPLLTVLQNISQTHSFEKSKQDANFLHNITKLSWRTMGFRVEKLLGELEFPGLLAARYFSGWGTTEFIATRPAKKFFAYLGERNGVLFLLGQTGRYENSIGNIETSTRIDIVIPLKSIETLSGLLKKQI